MLSNLFFFAHLPLACLGLHKLRLHLFGVSNAIQLCQALVERHERLTLYGLSIQSNTADQWFFDQLPKMQHLNAHPKYSLDTRPPDRLFSLAMHQHQIHGENGFLKAVEYASSSTAQNRVTPA